jgi:hypothetical protein
MDMSTGTENIKAKLYYLLNKKRSHPLVTSFPLLLCMYRSITRYCSYHPIYKRDIYIT